VRLIEEFYISLLAACNAVFCNYFRIVVINCRVNL